MMQFFERLQWKVAFLFKEKHLSSNKELSMTCKRFWRIRIEKYIRVRHKTHKNSLSILKPQIFRILERALILFKWYSYLLCAISLKTLLHPRTNLPEKAISNLPKRWDNYPSKAFIFECFYFHCVLCLSPSPPFICFSYQNPLYLSYNWPPRNSIDNLFSKFKL